MADGVSDSDGPVFCCEEDCRNSAILQTTLNKATRRRDRNDNSFRVALVRIETQALAAFQVTAYMPSMHPAQIVCKALDDPASRNVILHMSDFSSQPAAVVTSVDALAGAVRAAQHAHGAAMRLAERVGRYSERMKFLRAVQAAKDDMRKMKDTLAIYSRVIRTYQLTFWATFELNRLALAVPITLAPRLIVPTTMTPEVTEVVPAITRILAEGELTSELFNDLLTNKGDTWL
ncbi:unnamed protein product [Notodromas monacha]|uniref:Uncharacterized protein n=1 Tax=Notodromas monacha TaxID=399045 RepID=A0A7R9BKI7_9CRUS|nr:unnamed protein product [Notodromas monacha]CAG0917169.1 unnamed protein product [Notodromas monacha]